MKQRITPNQLQELSDEQKNRLREWWKIDKDRKYLLEVLVEKNRIVIPDEYDDESETFHYCAWSAAKSECLPLLSIGQMWELLADFTGGHDGDLNAFDPHVEIWTPNDMCDRLWHWVKIALQERVDGKL